MSIEKTVDRYMGEGLLSVNSKIKEDKQFTSHLKNEMKKILKAKKIEVKFQRGYYMGKAWGVDFGKTRNIVTQWAKKFDKLIEKFAFGKPWQQAHNEIDDNRNWKEEDVYFEVGVTTDGSTKEVEWNTTSSKSSSTLAP